MNVPDPPLRPDGAVTADQPCIVSFDLMPEDPDFYFVLTEALGDFAARQRRRVAEQSEDNGDWGSRIRWAQTAEAMLDRIEEALSTPAARRAGMEAS